MRAVVAEGPGRFGVARVREPEAREPGERVLDVEAAGVCAADRMLFHGTGPWRLSWPLRPGHELLGVDRATGERLAVQVKAPCGRCRWCLRGDDHLCPVGPHLGSGFPGAFAERVWLPVEARAHAVPASLPTAVAALAEPMACALHAVERLGPLPVGSRVVVSGLGGVGSCAVVAAAAAGLRVTALVRSTAAADRARALGAADAVEDPGSDAAREVEGWVECSGDRALVVPALQALSPGGVLSLYGVYGGTADVPLDVVAELGEREVRGGHLAPSRTWARAVGLLARVPDAALVVRGELGLEELPAALAAGGTGKLVVRP